MGVPALHVRQILCVYGTNGEALQGGQIKPFVVRARLLRPLLPVLLASALAGCQAILGQDRVVQLLEVAPQKVACTGMGPMECLLVREQGETDWTYFYDGIAGFTYEPGFSYLLRVQRTEVRNPPVDGSGYEWRLLEMISKKPST